MLSFVRDICDFLYNWYYLDRSIEFEEACENGDIKIVEYLFRFVDPSNQHNWPIRIASQNGHVEIVRLLLEDPRVDPSEFDNRALQNACSYHHLKVVKLLLTDPRVNPSASHNMALACAAGCIKIMEFLLEDPRVVSSSLSSALRLAIVNGYIDAVNLLLEYPLTVRDINMAIEYAKYYDKTEILESLTEHLYRLDGPIYNEGILC
uniref:Uncharacterized protein n=1 Tax=viral metagenome TaxID=1070528 RepID=A0A6C0JVN8_9ZZZZ